MQPELTLIQTVKDGTISDTNISGEIVPYMLTISQMEALKSLYENIDYILPLESQVIDIINNYP